MISTFSSKSPGRSALPDQEGVRADDLVGRALPDHDAVLDAPELRIAVPVLEQRRLRAAAEAAAAAAGWRGLAGRRRGLGFLGLLRGCRGRAAARAVAPGVRLLPSKMLSKPVRSSNATGGTIGPPRPPPPPPPGPPGGWLPRWAHRRPVARSPADPLALSRASRRFPPPTAAVNVTASILFILISFFRRASPRGLPYTLSRGPASRARSVRSLAPRRSRVLALRKAVACPSDSPHALSRRFGGSPPSGRELRRAAPDTWCRVRTFLLRGRYLLFRPVGDRTKISVRETLVRPHLRATGCPPARRPGSSSGCGRHPIDGPGCSKQIPAAIRTYKPDGRWSVQEHAGAPPRPRGAVGEPPRRLRAGRQVLRPADLQNRRTHEARTTIGTPAI